MDRSDYGIELRERRIMSSLANSSPSWSDIAFTLGLPAGRSRQDDSMWGRLADAANLLSSPAVTATLPYLYSSRQQQCIPTCSSPGLNATFELVLWLAYRPPVAEPNLLNDAKWWGGVSARGSRQRGSGVENGVKTKQRLPPGTAADVSAQPNGSIGRTTQREGRCSTRAARSSLVAFCGLAGGHPLWP